MATFIQNLINGVSLGSIYALIALGYTLVYGILRLINFAHGDLFMLAAYAALGACAALGLGDAVSAGLPVSSWGAFALVLALSMAAAAAAGWLVERLAYRPLRGQPRLNLLITAVGVSLLLENGAQAVFGASPRRVPALIVDAPAFSVAGAQVSVLDLAVLGCALALLLALDVWVHRTRMGRAMRAVSHSHETAALLGIPVDRVISITFAVGSALAAAAAVLYGAKYPKVDPLMGVMPGIKAFVAAVLGGIGNLRGAVLGAMILGLAETLVAAYGASSWRDALAFGLLILILLFKPSGLLGSHQREKV
ncbi:MAG TPA: branched-chain amino acid ABC transporter permease [bacterium]|nr:branched-chain amino acid ABC transporter permease [bacterium]